MIPAAAGHAAQTAPRGLAVALDWLHVTLGVRSGSAAWSGCSCSGAAQPAARRIAVLAVVVPRFSNVALVSVAVLLASGIWATVLHLPLLSALWTTSYGQVILVKAALLATAMLLGAVNLVRTKPRLAAARHAARSSRPRPPRCSAGSSRSRC